MNMFRTTMAAAIAAATVLSANAAFAYERWIDIVNTSGAAVYSVYMTHVDQTSWGRDLLGNHVVPAGDVMRIEPDLHQGYCRFDIRVVYESGYEEIFPGVNLCEATRLYA